MTFLTPWLHILLALIAYFVVAILASVAVRKTGGDLKSMEERSSPRILLIGAAANLGVLAIVLLLLVIVDGLPISALGLTLTSTDLIGALTAAFATVVLAVAYVGWLSKSGQIQVKPQQPASSRAGIRKMGLGLLVLLVVVLQEEVLYRGYVVLNVQSLGALAVILISTLIFVLIHFLTNRVNRFQVVSWTVSGLVLAAAYLASGSIWVPVILHYATDLTNVLVFNITGQSSLFAISPALSEQQRAVYRGVYGMAVMAIFLLFLAPGCTE
jgi:membrane protease YdiL (CAAX protease family)